MPDEQFTVLVTDYAWPDLELEQGILAEAGAEIVAAPTGVEQELVLLAADADAIITCWAQVTDRVIEAAPKLRVVARYGIGLDNIAVGVCTRRRIPVTYVPDYCVEEVSDHALALVLACARNIAFFHLKTKQGEYDLKAGPRMRRLRGQVLGLLGLGRIARTLVPKARGLGLQVVAATPSSNDYGLGVEMVSLDELLARSDYVSLHLPSNRQTRHLIGAAELAAMKPTAYLINTSRGALVDEVALAAALEKRQIGGAALDVFDPEPPELRQPLFRSERVIVTPHAAFWSAESLEELRRRTATQVADVLSGRTPENVVNPEVYAPAE
jgi:D-3-phosphoglycerate dehydrogenase